MYHSAWILIVSQSDKFRVTKVIDLRFILHLFLSWTANNDLLVIECHCPLG
jgi:hypothetical protein